MQPASTEFFRAFTGAPGQHRGSVPSGNPCVVHHLSGAPGFEAHHPHPTAARATRCLTWTTGPRRAAVRCFTAAGVAIRCCGHGLLSCARHWLNEWGHNGTLHAGDSDILVESDGERYWCALSRLSTAACALPDWASSLVGAPVIAAAAAGDENGYLVLELAPNTNLATLPAPGDLLAGHTQRALILTSAVSDTAAPYADVAQIRSRYFAPQYGVPEDAATGSAMRILADYWAGRGSGDRLVAQQQSPAGGLLFSRIVDERVWIGGYVTAPQSADYGLEPAACSNAPREGMNIA